MSPHDAPRPFGHLRRPGDGEVLAILAEQLGSRPKLLMQRFMEERSAVTGAAIVALMFVLAYLSPLIATWRYDQLDSSAFLSPPSTAHWFGTTQSGADVFALTMRGMQKSLIIGLLGALVSTALAAVVGACAGYFGGGVGVAIGTLIDALLALPAFLIIAMLSPLFQEQTWLALVALLAAFQWMLTARVVRNLTMSLKERDFVHAARFMGVSGWRIILRHVLPNMSSLLIVDATLNVSALILAEVGLSFFGFGVQPPDVSLGTMIGNHAGAVLTYPWQFYFPAGCLLALILAVNLVGDGLREAFDSGADVRVVQ